MDRFSSYVIGQDTLLLECCEVLLRKGHEVRGVITSSERVAQWARDHQLPVIPDDGDLAARLREEPFDFLFAITHLSILPPEVIATPRRLAINFHDGPLPNYAGLHAPAWALIDRQTEYGVSWHVITPEIDQGDLLKQQRFLLHPQETSISLNTRCFTAGLESFNELIDDLASNRVTRTPQDLTQRRYFGRRQRPDACCVLDPRKPAAQLAALVRALDFGPYENPLGVAKLVHRDRVVRIARAEARDDRRFAEAGTVLSIHDHEIVIATSEQAFVIQEVTTLEGNPLSLRQWATDWSLAEGDPLVGLDDATAEEWSREQRELAKSESYWVKQLSHPQPLQIPYLHDVRTDDESVMWQRCSIDLQAANLPAVGAEDTLVASIIAYLARLSQQSAFDIAYVWADGNHAEACGTSLVSGHGLWRVNVDESACCSDHIRRTSNGRAPGIRRRPWLRDLMARYSVLRDEGVREAVSRPRVVIHAQAEPTTVPPAGVHLGFMLAADGGRCELVFDPRALRAESAVHMAQQLTAWLRQLIERADQSVASLALVTDNEREQILSEWNHVVSASTDEARVDALFLAQVERTPTAPALTFGDETLSYEQLNLRANQLAHRLVAQGVVPGDVVGLHVERSLAMVVGMLGILKAGAAYCPLDPNFPVDRLRFMTRDARMPILVTQRSLRGQLGFESDREILVDELQHSPTDPVVTSTSSLDALAYVMYTSGSTGTPKGVMVEHRNVAAFFRGMDDVIPRETNETWLAVTTFSFDISVLEILWSLCRGLHVVLASDATHASVSGSSSLRRPGALHDAAPMEFSLYYWGNDDQSTSNKYELLLAGAKFADEHDFVAVWTPERHFHAFGGPYPNPAVTGAAVAAITRKVQIRAGSCVLPLHHPLRVAEEWSVVDNLSNGRAAVAFASGWQPHDFVLRPEVYGDHKARMFEMIEIVKRLWRGESVEFLAPHGELVPRVTQPRPVQAELPIWITTAGNPETYQQAGTSGAHVLTHLLGQSVDDVAEKIRIYRAARERAGHDPLTGKVTLMLHTLLGASDDEVRKLVREPLKEYLASSVALVKKFSWAFPAFKRPRNHQGVEVPLVDPDLEHLSPEELDAILEFAFERYFESSGLFGSVESGLQMVRRLKAIGVDEIACLIDFGVPASNVIEHLPYLDAVRQQTVRSHQDDEQTASSSRPVSLGELISHHQVTHFQCTPSHAQLLLAHDDAQAIPPSVRHVFVGGEALPLTVARQLSRWATHSVTNMYGPTETTVWASTQRITGNEEQILIGRPLATSRMYVLDSQQRLVPAGVPGELYIGGQLVARGYYGRPELTAERFLADPFVGGDARMYRTGDLAMWHRSGELEFLGRNDSQVKIRGYRIELGEIEAKLAQHPSIVQAIVMVREDTPGDQRLVAYLAARGDEPTLEVLQELLRRDLPEYMIPSHFLFVERFALTPNGKIDRSQLRSPSLEPTWARRHVAYAAPSDDIQSLLARLWCDILSIEKVGVDDNFFDVGGHSLLVVRVHRELQQSIGRPVSLTDLYRFPTIRSLATHLANDDGAATDLQSSDQRANQRREALDRRRQRNRQLH